MTNKEKLIELLDIIIQPSEKTLGQIADYLLENGVIVLPCKIGDAVYYVNYKEKRIFHSYIKYITITTKGLTYVTHWDSAYHDEDFGETIFFTKEEAETKLKEGQQNG